MENISRRLFGGNLLGSLFAFSILKTLSNGNLLAGSIKPVAQKWVAEIDQLSKSLMDGKTRQVEWQKGIESLLKNVDLNDLMKAIDIDRLEKSVVLQDNHETVEDISLAGAKEPGHDLNFAPYFYALKKGRAIVPHGHHNIVTMHMMLKGQAHGRHFDRISDDEKYMTVRPTRDKICDPGEVTTISDQRDNIHWFVALSEPVYMFNIGVYGIDSKVQSRGRDYVAIDRGEKLADGTLRVPKIDGETAYLLYGKT